MVRKFLSLDGEVVAEEEWKPKPTDLCFYCDHPLILADTHPCLFMGPHEFVTLVIGSGAS